jgi:hypothetical protein
MTTIDVDVLDTSIDYDCDGGVWVQALVAKTLSLYEALR